jgi:tetratricopeptide (TPR) repeat protein
MKRQKKTTARLLSRTAQYLCDMYLKLNNRAEALSNYHRAIKIDEGFIVPYINLAEIYYGSK